MRTRDIGTGLLAAFVVACAGLAHAQPANLKPLSTQDYIEIQQLYARYNHLIDSGDAEGWANTFTPDGVFNNASRGHDALVQFVRDWRDRRNGKNLRHWNSNLVVTPTADGAAGSIYMFLLDVAKQPPQPTAAYLYDDVLVRTPAGWRFKSRTLHREDHP